VPEEEQTANNGRKAYEKLQLRKRELNKVKLKSMKWLS